MTAPRDSRGKTIRDLRDIKMSEGLKPLGVTAEQRFKRVVYALHDAGFMPTPSLIRYCCHLEERPYGTSAGASHGSNLNGRESKWRGDTLEGLGYVKDWNTNRWRAPVR